MDLLGQELGTLRAQVYVEQFQQGLMTMSGRLYPFVEERIGGLVLRGLSKSTSVLHNVTLVSEPRKWSLSNAKYGVSHLITFLVPKHDELKLG